MCLTQGTRLSRIGSRCTATATVSRNRAEQAAVAEAIQGKVASMGKPAWAAEKSRRRRKPRNNPCEASLFLHLLDSALPPLTRHQICACCFPCRSCLKRTETRKTSTGITQRSLPACFHDPCSALVLVNASEDSANQGFERSPTRLSSWHPGSAAVAWRTRRCSASWVKVCPSELAAECGVC